MPTAPEIFNLVTRFHEALPTRIRDYLHGRGLSDAVIDLHLLGWNGIRITIPIFDREGRPAFFKLAKDPADGSPGPKMMTSQGGYAELYGWERVKAKPERIVICEGEFDRLVLEARGIAAVTSTGGAGVFRKEWAETLAGIPEVYLCFDRDDAGDRGALQVARMIPHARVLALPEDVGHAGDVTDFFVRLEKETDDFLRLMREARPFPRGVLADPPVSVPEVGDRFDGSEIARVKDRVPIASIVSHHVTLRRSGKSLKGLCPFHEDHEPSLVVYPEDGRFHCFGCGAKGDVITFLMKVERLTFPEAVQYLQRLAE